ncbi:KxDL motif-containing protein 1 [Rhizophlyctis rosea]|uniref:KxDL motif-containing protein 1 n=1 Tax=Rhizophlyctis rosea TaxID=64517 RepID=A0AAD5SJG5_9FUNG|nr:KxDL motif-containing protein 1 [Rhizophlyctis rosea]
MRRKVQHLVGLSIEYLLNGTYRMQTLHKTSESLETFNNFSSARYAENLHQIQSYTKQLKEMKDDLDVVFKRIRTLKAKVATKHPAEYAEVMTRHEGEEEDDD